MKSEQPLHSPEDLVQTFAACENFPTNRAAVLLLAQALKRASDDFRIPMQEIVQTCADASRFCPTPREIRNMGLALRDERRQKAEGNRNAKWEALYGPPDLEWSDAFLGLAASATHPERLRAVHIRAIRDMLYYTEGDGSELGDRQYWEAAAERDHQNYPELIAQIRTAGGWQNERELQQDWVDVAWQPEPEPTRRGAA